METQDHEDPTIGNTLTGERLLKLREKNKYRKLIGSTKENRGEYRSETMVNTEEKSW